ncbi:FAD/NAD(P)-binding oxidoreductase [Rhizobium sp. Leaf386]|uniref:NAD(P)/FAD-dependent oxidoreductase n=1 Tax=Rhizobium sp. Leaf386 TaxID=1736359 RepID=UPI000712D7F7|nr:FAD/NAD(P)-binding oxidoreductase [Rhizobium sp. Leaf386]KQS89429.1 hypothetical protein ASG50_27975 [Rhizobium sp. Leaf386]
MQYVILGNGAAGNSAAERLRQNDPHASIALVCAERHPHYSRVALPRFVRGQITEDKVMMRSVESYAKLNIDAQLGVKALGINAETKRVKCDDGRTLAYDKLLIATGGRPRPSAWAQPGDDRRSLPFQTVDDARAIISLTSEARHVLVVGGGFIGYELAESIAFRKQAKVTWMMRGPWFLPHVLDASAGAIARNLAEEAGVDLITNDEIETIDKSSAGYRVTTRSGRRLDVDLIAQGIGIDYHTEVALTAGLVAAPGIRTDSRLRTPVQDIYAAGDIALFYNERTGRYTQTGSWDSAIAQGKTVADNMAGGDAPFVDVSTYTTSLFGSTLAVLGDVHAGAARGEKITIESDGDDYRQFHIVNGKLVGAILIGSPKGRKRFIELIRTEVPVSAGIEEVPRLNVA